MRHDIQPIRCANEGCGREAAAGERFCEACSLEWALFRRDTRPESPEADRPQPPEISSAGGPAAPAGARSARLR